MDYNQGIIDSTGTETWQIFFLYACKDKKRPSVSYPAAKHQNTANLGLQTIDIYIHSAVHLIQTPGNLPNLF